MTWIATLASTLHRLGHLVQRVAWAVYPRRRGYAGLLRYLTAHRRYLFYTMREAHHRAGDGELVAGAGLESRVSAADHCGAVHTTKG